MSVAENLRRWVPLGQAARYLLVGAWNTLFGYLLYAGLTYLLTGRIPCAYLAAALLGNVIAVTVAFLGYKWFVFRTRGNYLREYLRCWTVYGVSTVVGLAALPLVVVGLTWSVGPHAWIPYLAGGLLTGVTVIISFLGHKNFSFAARPRNRGET